MSFRVIAVDGGIGKEALCTSLWAEVFIDFEKVTDIPSRVIEITGGVAAANRQYWHQLLPYSLCCLLCFITSDIPTWSC